MPRLVGSPKDAASPEQCLLSQAKRQACYHCRVQKLRCSEERPCSPCTKREIQCTSQQPPCTECRRQKLKCSGGQPCSGCEETGKKCRSWSVRKRGKRACYTCSIRKVKCSEERPCLRCTEFDIECTPVYRRRDMNINQTPPMPPVKKEGLPAVSVPGTSSLGDPSPPSETAPHRFDNSNVGPLVRSTGQNECSWQNTLCSHQPTIDPEEGNPSNHHDSESRDGTGMATWILCCMTFPPHLRTEALCVEGYISSCHPRGQVTLKLTAETVDKLVQRYRLNYSGYSATSANDWYQTQLQLEALYAQFNQVLVNFSYSVSEGVFDILRRRQEHRMPDYIQWHVEMLLWGIFFPLDPVYTA